MRYRTRYDASRFAGPPSLDGGEFPVLASMIDSVAKATLVSDVTVAVTEATRALLRADGTAFVLREGDQCFYADEDAVTPLWKGLRFPASSCLSGWCMAQGKPAVIEDVTLDPRAPVDAYRPTFVRGMVMVPVNPSTPVAAIGAYWAACHRASKREVAILEMIAGIAALGLERLAGATIQVAAKANEEYQRTLVGEISHRVKNTLAVVQAMAIQTMRSSSSLETFKETFLARLNALGSAHGLLVQEDWKDVRLRELVAAILQHVTQPGARISLYGADIRLPPRAHLSMAMALHELAINAVRHGALARPGGSLRIRWRAQDSADRGPTLSFTWEENGPGTDQAPLMPGLGLTLVDRLIRHDLRGDCVLERLPPRLLWRLNIPCSELVNTWDVKQPMVGRTH